MSGGPRIGLLGTFDVDDYGDLLYPRLFERELARRLPDASVRSFSPFGDAHPVGKNAGWSPERLGLWTRDRLRELSAELDLVAVGGGEIIHMRDELLAEAYAVDPLELRLRRPSDFFVEYPAVWHAVGVPFDLDAYEARVVREALSGREYVAVRDERSRTRLVAAGVTGEIAVVPDSAFLLDRLFAVASLDAARDGLRARGAYPPEGRPLVLQGIAALLEHVEAVVAAIPSEPDVVLLEMGRRHGDDRFADAVAERLGRPAFRVGGASTLEDVAAAVAGGASYVGSSMHGAITALVHGVPALMLDLGGAHSELAGLADLLGRPDLRETAVPAVLQGARPADVAPLQARVDAHFDRIAELALAAPERTASSPQAAVPPATADTSAAHELTRRRLLEERRRYADLVVDVAAERDAARAELAEAKRYIASLEEARSR
jgi:hypothetical protein